MAAFFSLSFFQSLVTTVLGAGLAILSAIWVDRWLSSRRIRGERNELTVALDHAIKSNLELLRSVEESLRHRPLDDCDPVLLDLTLLNSTSARKYELLRSISTCKAIDGARYQLEALNVDLDSIRRELGEARRSALVAGHVERLRSSCQAKIGTARDALLKAERELQSIQDSKTAS